jgi:uncharacterized protein (UPF0335 family)
MKKELISKMVRVLMEMQSLDEVLKEIKDEAKEAGLNPSVLVAVAKAIANSKVDDLQEKSQELLDTIELTRS